MIHNLMCGISGIINIDGTNVRPETLAEINNTVDTSGVEKFFAQLLEGGDAESFLDRISYRGIGLSLPDDMLGVK